MFLYGNIRLFIVKVIFGLTMTFISFLLFVSLYSYSPNDMGFGISSEITNISNWGGVYGAYFARLLIVFFNLSSYFFTLFLLVNGLKLTLGINTGNLLIKFSYFLLGISLFNLAASATGNGNGGLVGDFLKIFSNSYLEKYFENFYILWFSFFLTALFSAILLFLSLGINSKYIKNKYYFKFFYLFFIPFFLLKKIITPAFKRSGGKDVLKRSFNKKKEPTIISKRQNTSNIRNIKPKQSSSENMRYELPPISLLKISNEKNKHLKEANKKNSEFAKKLEKVLEEYGVQGQVVNYKYGPVVTLFEFLPAPGIKTSKVVGLSNDIARAMSSISTRISSQPGKNSIGIEIPNSSRENVFLGDLIADEKFLRSSGLTLALGKDISGEKKYTDLEKMPHLLIAGTTGSGKSVGINSMIVSLLYKYAPSECKLILIDPKMLELSIYEDIPHLLTPVVTNPNKAVFALKWVVKEMENRYRLMSSLNVKNIITFNSKIKSAKSLGRKLYREVQTGIDKDTRKPIIEKKEIPLEKMPLIVVVIDEMADLMMVAGKEVENLVQRLAQMARASGIHIIAATQRPSVDVITGTIKANFPSRISFRVASRFDSRTILNEMGAEQLLGSGDMLFLENGSHLSRVHGGYISESEIENIVNHIKSQASFTSTEDITVEEETPSEGMAFDFSNKDKDELYERAVSLILEQQKVSTSYVQRYLQIGYNRAARMIEKMEEDGYISEPSNAGKRIVLKKNR